MIGGGSKSNAGSVCGTGGIPCLPAFANSADRPGLEMEPRLRQDEAGSNAALFVAACHGRDKVQALPLGMERLVNADLLAGRLQIFLSARKLLQLDLGFTAFFTILVF